MKSLTCHELINEYVKEIVDSIFVKYIIRDNGVVFSEENLLKAVYADSLYEELDKVRL